MYRPSRHAAIALLIAISPSMLGAQELAELAASAASPASTLSRSIDKWSAAITLSTQAQPVACDASKSTGKQDAARRHGMAGWFLGGVAAGVGLGLIGTGIITGVSAIGNPQPKEIPPGQEENCYRDGYASQAKHKNVISGLLGGVTGTVAWLVIYLNSRNDDVYYYY